MWRRANLFIDVKTKVDEDASGYKEFDKEIDDLTGFIVADDVKYKIIY